MGMTAEERKEAKAYLQSRLDWKKENRYPYISAQEAKIYKIALEALNGDAFEGTYEVELEKDGDVAFDVIGGTDTPQQKMEQWIFVDKAREHARCPKCGYGDIDLMDGKPHNYCQNCGIGLKIQTESEEIC